ncbi:hypothetical protein GCM10011594_35270 [Nakamurella endophytica]|uniref:Uncharacterized protein n=1 Tax=Nakamurella endophytica TaxID=1748367 RepID=A0A917T983_9ACTN|nr:hypothetical protein GCM10011594_35270 [Nakamurella endophytica]
MSSSPGSASVSSSRGSAPVSSGITSASASASATDSLPVSSGPRSGPSTSTGPARSVPPAATLPGGGRTLFPGHLLVALYGQPGISGLGVLGEQDVPESITRARRLAARYAELGRGTVVPTFEIIATIADSAAGPDGDYSAETDVETLRSWVDAATAAGLYVVLDLQPGRTDFLTQARRYAELLQRPNVGLALDPEWRLGPGQRHLQQIGSVHAAEVNAVADWLAALTAQHHLPQKLLLLHQFTRSMILERQDLDARHPELAVVIQMDGQGNQDVKDETWQSITADAPAGVRFGWKNFLRRDHPVLDPAGSLAKDPTPVLISYE